MSFPKPEISESLCIFPHRDIELSVITTNADFESMRDLFIERYKRYIYMSKTHMKMIQRNTQILSHDMSPASTAIIPRGAHITCITLKKSLSIESFTSSGDIHL